MARSSAWKMHKHRAHKRQVRVERPPDFDQPTFPSLGSDSSTTSSTSSSTSTSTFSSSQQTTATTKEQSSGGNTALSSDPSSTESQTSTTSSSSSTSSTSSTTSTSSSSSSASSTALISTATSQSTALVANTFLTNPAARTTALTGTGTIAGAAATNTATGSASGGLSTGAIVGIAAGGLVGFGVLIMVGLFVMKRIFRKKEDDDFDRNSFIRQSANLEDVEEDYSRPRPPTMIERHTGVAGIGAHGYANFAPPVPAAGYGPASPDPFLTPISEFPPVPVVPNQYQHHPYGRATSPPHLQPDQAQYNADPRMSPPLQGDGYASLERSSVTPYQAAQYAEISRQLNTTAANSPATPTFPQDGGRALSPQRVSPMSPGPYGNAQLVTIPENAHTGHEANVQYGYHEASAPPAALRVVNESPAHGQRPRTVYNEDDAYGGM